MNAASWLEALPASDRWRARLLRDGPRIVTWILAIALGVQAALILTDLVAARRGGAGGTVRQGPAHSRLVDLAAITNAHLFGAAPTLKQDGANAPQTSMPLVLTGIIAGNDPQNGLAILGPSAQATKVYAVGDNVPGGAKLHSVYSDRVVIDRDGRLESLSLPRQMNAGNAPPPSSAALTRLGLRPGDQVTAINGTPLDDRERGEQILRTLGSSSEARVTLIRQGQQQDLSLNIAQVAQEAQRITPNFKDADITQIAEAVSAATGKTFIVDPRVRAQVTMLSTTPMSPAAFYETFLSILQVYGFIAVPAGNVVKILPDANARQIPSIDLPDHVSATSDEIVTQVIDVKNVSAAQLVPILRPLIPQYGQLAAYPASNILIISDRANNVNRIIRIIRRIDQVGDQDVEVIPLQNASSAEIVRVINSLYQGQAAAEGGMAAKVVADDRSNSVLVGGDQSQRLRIRALIAHLDTPLEAGGDTQVRYLRYADAEKIAPKLKEQITGVAQAAGGGAGGAAGAASPQAQAEKSAMVWADPQNNALVITAPPKIMRAVMGIIDKLDIRRRQVLVEAIIVEVTSDKTAEFG